MKYFILTFFFISSYFCFAQGKNLRTYSGGAVDSNTCVFDIKLVDLITIDSLHVEIRKPKVERLVDYLKSCKEKYTFDEQYQDREIRLTIPKYLCKISYELGDQHFAIVIRDTTEFERTIAFTYDLDDGYKNHFLTHDNVSYHKTGSIKLNNQTIYRFVNWDKRNAGTIFTSNHLNIAYFTKSEKFEPELEDVISKFSW
jgi:hypothetical protein